MRRNPETWTVHFALGLVLLVAPPSNAQEVVAGDTYTAEELAALDRALEAGNLTRQDLRFRKDVTEGHGCLPVVRRMLEDPLLIAPAMDRMVARQGELGARVGAPVAALAAAAELLEEGIDVLGRAARGFPGGVEPPRDTEELMTLLEGIALRQPRLSIARDDEDDALLLRVLRHRLPAEMAWHEVFDSPYVGEDKAAIDAYLVGKPQSHLQDLAARVPVVELAADWVSTFSDPAAWLPLLPHGAFPTDAPIVRETAHGRIALGTAGNDVWRGDFAVLIDPGGDDRYENCRIGCAPGTDGRRVGFFADLGGDDVYACRDTNLTLGSAVLGIAAFYDLGVGDDVYHGGHGTLGAAVGGVAVFHDDGGSEVYEGRTFTQGAAGYGIAVFHDDSVQERPVMTSDEGTKDPVDVGLFDNDRLVAWANAQAFARPRSVALCINRRGNEIYQAGGVYLNAPLFADRYQSFAQGFSIGERGIDFAGGIALLVDHDGNDRYLGDIYNQGVGYWYGAGLLWDGGGNDTYEMTQYGQGSGIHLAVGGLVDVAGHDAYVMHSGLGQGGSHDYAGSVLHDRGGNDRYHGNTSCNGCGLTNSVGLHIDRSGDDTYAGRRGGSVNFGRPARDFPSIGILIDLAGNDDYLGVMRDGEVWRHTDIGVGIDVTPPAPDPDAPRTTPAPDQLTGKAEIPAICGYEGELTPEVFDQLWEIAVRWEVGDNRVIVPEARKRLVAFGVPVLALLDGKVETDDSGLELRAFVDVLRGVAAAQGDPSPRTAVVEFLRLNAASEMERRRRVALYLIGELAVVELEDAVADLLNCGDAGLARRAAGTLAQIGSHAGDEVLLTWLAPGAGELETQAAVNTLVKLETDCYPALRPLLAHPSFAVRMRLVTLLAGRAAVYREGLVADLVEPALPLRTRRTLLDVLTRAALPPSAAEIAAVAPFLDAGSPGLRADASRLVRSWQGVEGTDRGAIAALVERVEHLAATDPDPCVRFAAKRSGDTGN